MTESKPVGVLDLAVSYRKFGQQVECRYIEQVAIMLLMVVCMFKPTGGDFIYFQF